MVETHDYRRSREYGIFVAPWVGTHGMSKREEVDPDEEHDGEVPILQHRQVRHSLRHFETPYTNEQRKYY